jgi:hypothetical protein
MIDHLERDIRQLAERLDTSAPSISGAEVRTRREAPVSFEEGEIATVTVMSDHRRRSVLKLAVAATTAVASVVAVLVLLSARSTAPFTTSPQTFPSPGPTTIVPTTTVPSTTIPPPTTVPLGEQLDRIATTVSDRLSTLHSVGFTSTIRSAGQPDVSNKVVVRSDGAFWAERDGLWGSYDPQTGLLRGGYTYPDGTLGYDELAGQTPSNPGRGILIGLDPVPTGAVVRQAQSVIEAVHDGRPVWQLEVSYPKNTAGLDSFAVLMIDQATGLLVSELQTTVTDGVTTSHESTLTNLVVDAQLPAVFPGTFPADATVNRSGDPKAAPIHSVDEAAQRFGPGFIAPAEFPTGSWIQVLHDKTSGTSNAEIVIPRGFLATLIYLSINPDAGQPVLSAVPPSPTLTGGDLAGRTYYAGDGSVSVSDGRTEIVVSAPSIDEALRIANSLKRIS